MRQRGLSVELDLSAIINFGAEADRLEFPRIAEGGFIVPGGEPAPHSHLGKETIHHAGATPGEEAGPAARSRERPSAQAPATSSSTHAVGSVDEAILDALRDYGARITVVRSTPRFVDVKVPVGLFADLPYRAELYFEVPRVKRSDLRRGMSMLQTLVPDVRGWARWADGSRSGELVVSHHQYPDSAICACMPNQWVLGRDPLLRYVDYCVVWIGKVLHEELTGRYPGLQHFGEKVRVERDRIDEYCGCAKPVRYADCHRGADQELGIVVRNQRHYAAQRAYLNELDLQGRASSAPEWSLSHRLQGSVY